MKKVLLLMSGGVDSSYCAYLLQKQGYLVYGVYLKLHDKEEKHAYFVRNIEKCAKHLNIEYSIIDERELFKTKVYDYFVESYKKGLTPNPCAMCNPFVKFGIAFDLANKMGFDYVATGHYAQIKEGKVAQGADMHKDQSYFLFGLKPEWISRIIFPLGDKIKEEIKPVALKELSWLGTLETYKDSQEICFVENSYIDVLNKHYKTESKGDVLDTQGNVIGTHKGYMQYTIGKRKGFTIKGALTPHYVLKINPQDNTIIVGDKEDLATKEVRAANFSLPKEYFKDDNTLECEVKIRYKSHKAKARIELVKEAQKEVIVAHLEEPVYGVASGQALVLYDGSKVLGGGFIL
ncbi:tRNA 2-thiouridine(34) synthase MnmA [Helicobacter sp.]|uniref:tRNA 2-thiouridine(34) synthase MnmA n=1 Tax=Helicobacter sp. TaxID=218 RepID=UPI0025BA8006|nr:tRNA 2-thiouridine(34) synthase MnmA [Helicobacter sp.]MCI5967926.1 tRNA 2-thiouridine(34) synthase MnmA [Helicobacter sp.]MDY2585288.1 tRNA 2-thiouridine(34) synthase MnmA [Helicobacter sp.]